MVESDSSGCQNLPKNREIQYVFNTFRADYARYQNQAGLPVMGWNAGAVGFDYSANQQYENLPK